MVLQGFGDGAEDRIEQPLQTGLVSKAFNEGKTVCHQGLFRHADQDDTVDSKLGQVTAHQISVPLELFGRRCGVLSAIQSFSANPSRGKSWGFDDEAVSLFEFWAAALGELLEYRWLRSAGDS